MSTRRRARRRKATPEPATETPKEPAADPAPTPAPTPPEAATAAPQRRSLGQLEPLLLLRAAHPRQALLTGAVIAGVAAADGRAGREVAVVFATVLVGQAMIGWHNDLVDRKRDLEDERPRKPVADGSLEPGTVWFAIACAALLVVPLSITSGLIAGVTYLIALAVGLLGNVLFRKGWLSWLTWAVSFGLYPAFLSYGGWGGEYEGPPPEIAVTALAAGLGVCVHFLRALPGLVTDNRHGFRHLPLRLALRIGAPRLLYLTIIVTVVVAAGLVVALARVGLAQ